MEATKYQKRIFSETFYKFIDMFEMHDWEVSCRYRPISSGTLATLHTYPENKTAVVTMNEDVPEQFDAESTGLHEALHLLMTRISILAYDRHASAKKIYDAEERIVQVLENVIMYVGDKDETD